MGGRQSAGRARSIRQTRDIRTETTCRTWIAGMPVHHRALKISISFAKGLAEPESFFRWEKYRDEDGNSEVPARA